MSGGQDNPPAFPVPDVRTHDGFGLREGSDGMSLRDWFAGQALAGRMHNGFACIADAASHARVAYKMADAMLAARATPSNTEGEAQ